MALLVRELLIAQERRYDAHDHAMRIAWHAAAFARQKRMPDFRRTLARRGRQTVGQQVAALEQLSEHYKIPLRRRRRNVARVN